MRILVIDDEKYIADTMVMILRDSGWEAEAVYDGASGVAHAESFRPQVVISDVIMPGMNGIEACSAIQTKYPDCRCLLFSGQAATIELLQEARGKGLTWELLQKPIEPEDLLSKLASFRS